MQSIPILLLFLIASVFPQISVLQPKSLASLVNPSSVPIGNIRYNISMFGDIHYSEFQNLEVVLPERGNAFGCQELFTPKLAKKQQFAFLLRRGQCNFSKKAQNAKLVGAAMVFIFFEKEQNYTDFMAYFMFAPYFKENMIPAVLLDHNASQKIKTVLSTDTPVILKVALQVETERHERTEVEFVLVVNNLESYRRLSEVSSFTRALQSKMDFKPVYYFKQISLEDYKNIHIMKDQVVSQHCFHGKYCLHHETSTGHFQLQEYFEEGLRQLCLWKQCDQKVQWWQYTEHYSRKCLQGSRHSTLRKCYEAIMKEIGILSLVPSIDKCVLQSQVKNKKGEISDNLSRFFNF